ncbi:MAG: hypothetical protein HYT82_02130 [Candidatus Harrisonbacteria bacterium]|nr:hypothetical protein [Candidatus Harrisonbacteria bacterium]
MNTNREKVREYILKSGLTLMEKAEFSDFLSRAEESELAPIVKLFAEDASWVVRIFHNYKDKQAALDNRDPKLWEKIISEEEELLRGLK